MRNHPILNSVVELKLLGFGQCTRSGDSKTAGTEIRTFAKKKFLMETKNNRDSFVDLQVWLGYVKIMTVNHIGYSGGFASLCLVVCRSQGTEINMAFV